MIHIDFLDNTMADTSNDQRVTLEQWRALVAVIEAGGYAKAAETLNKSQSTISYSVAQLEQALSVKVFELKGRKASATPAGDLLYRRAKQLLAQAERLERSAICLSSQVEAVVSVAADQIIPGLDVLKCVDEFARTFPDTRVELVESVLSGTEDALLKRHVDIALSARVPVGFLGDTLATVTMQAMSSPDHPLQQLGREISYEDLRMHRQIIVRDSGIYRRHSEGWLDAEQRWTLSHIATSIDAVKSGMGYAWLPVPHVADELAKGRLVNLPLSVGAVRHIPTYLIMTNTDSAGPATRHLAELFKARLPSYLQRAR